MLERHLALPLRRAVQPGEPVLLQGPRGAGKTTLVCREYPGHLYVDLNDSVSRTAAQRNPGRFLASLRKRAIIDELQRAPTLVRHLQSHPIDLPLLFVADMRLSLPFPVFELHPPTRAERLGRPAMPLELLGHFVPAAQQRTRGSVEPESIRPSREFLWRDVPALVRVHDLDRFDRFVNLLEQRSGEILQQLHLARELDVAHRTIARWLEALNTCFLTLTLPPLDEAFSRRLVRRPKLHLPGPSQSFETQVVSELYGNARHAGMEPVLHYWRDSNGLEIPLIVQREPGTELIPCAIATVPSPADEARLQRWMQLAGVSHGAVIGREQPLLKRKTSQVLRYSFSDF